MLTRFHKVDPLLEKQSRRPKHPSRAREFLWKGFVVRRDFHPTRNHRPSRPDDIVAVMGRTEVLVKVLGPTANEIADPELLQIPVASFDLYVTSKRIAGQTLQKLAENLDERMISSAELFAETSRSRLGMGTIVERGDTLQVTGSSLPFTNWLRLWARSYFPPKKSDLAVLGIAVFVGVLLGAAIKFPIGGLKIALGTSVGTLLVGVLVGWTRSVRPWFGRFPDAAILFMRSIGLAAFVAMVGLKAGPVFIDSVRENGYFLFLGGIVVTLIPLISGLFFGLYVLKVNPALLVGGLAGAQTMIAGVAAVQEKSDSPVATLGYSCTVAFGHILLTTWGTIIVPPDDLSGFESLSRGLICAGGLYKHREKRNEEQKAFSCYGPFFWWQ